MGDLSICSWLLVPKLIAGEPKNDKSRKLLKQLIELQVVPDCTTSKGSNIGNQNDATTEAAERDVLTAINCGGLQRINVTRSAAGDVEQSLEAFKKGPNVEMCFSVAYSSGFN